jgi:type IV pilus biogenesis protein PilP
MSSFRFRKMPSVKLGLALTAGFLLSTAASAQTIPPAPAMGAVQPMSAQLPQPLPQVQPIPQVRPAANAVQPPAAPQAFVQPMQMQQGIDVPERKLALPAGASIGDASARVRSIAAEAGKSLDELVGAGLAPREQFDVDAIAERQRRLMLLKDQLEEAKVAKQIWQELHGKDSADDEKNSEKMKKLEEEKAFLEKRLRESDEKAASQSAPGADGSGDIPVVASVTGGGGSATARVLIPFSGVVTATPGMTLPNGMKIVSIASSGVVAAKDGKSFTLPFGSSVPRFKTPTKTGQAANGVGGQFQR